ncbi:MAG: ribosome maturation factor RimM [Chloroflexi bacterium AL-W]|nr:ribosome maturation factor RimM [Chloroflexi bacterium AL-N1]NOK67665.1 ribosome maturation factor RimM [Chloroflexi bacterium AL-N10]NOK75565.1 ribosome maturation factor RimM [Chloroflexi bacterium AL-N5]NOK82353.1 ribosome maturation factor RimM [Chloroflexi bacterium AL-W]NOK90198.1 ribosome maturation factor RimM [Chloroflexi bacterium AL-N15]
MTHPNTEEFLLVGKIVSAFGVRGQMRVRAYTDRVDHLCRNVRVIYLGSEYRKCRLKHVFEHKPGLLILSLEGVASREEAEALRNTDVSILEQDAAPLEDGEYFIHELNKLQVVTESGEVIGQVSEVLETGANDVLVVTRPGQKEALIPMIHDVVKELDIEGKRVVVQLIDGLIE